MHEALLFSQIPLERFDQVLHVLAGVTGSQPFPYQDQIALFAQLRLPETAASKKKSAIPQPAGVQQQRWIHKLLRPVAINTDSPDSQGPWRLRVEQTPDPSVKDHIAREVSESEVHDVKAFEDAGAFRFLGQQYVLGHRFVSGNVVVRIQRVHLAKEQMQTDKVLEGPPLPLSDLEILDPSGTFLIEVSVRMEDRKNTKIAEQAFAELEKFKRNMEGVIDLRVPDRLSLDTRVKG